MKRRILSIITALALCMGLLPTAVFATDETKYPIYVSGTQVTESNKDDILQGDETNDGKVSYDPENSVLTLNNASLTGGNVEDVSTSIGIYAEGALTICVTGNAEVKACDDYGVWVAGDLTVSGGGSLTVSGDNYGIVCGHSQYGGSNLNVTDTTLLAQSTGENKYNAIIAYPDWSEDYVCLYKVSYSSEFIEASKGYISFYTNYVMIKYDDRTPLASPQNVTIADGTASWGAVDGVKKYTVYLYRAGSETELVKINTNNTILDLSGQINSAGSGTYYVKVQSSQATDVSAYRAGELSDASHSVTAYDLYVDGSRVQTYLTGAATRYNVWEWNGGSRAVDLPYGAVFEQWYGLDGLTLTNEKTVADQDISFIMPDRDVYLTYSYTMGEISEFPVYVNGTQITKANMSDVFVDGTVSFTYDEDFNATLYLKNAELEASVDSYGYYNSILATDIPLTVCFDGTNTLGLKQDYYCAISNGSLFFCGTEGSVLTVQGAIALNLTFSDDVIVQASTSVEGHDLENYDAMKNMWTDPYYYYKMEVLTPPAAPTGIAGVNETIKGKHDGKITGVNNTMEYKGPDSENYLSITGNELTGLAAGTYYVRCKATNNTIASEAVEITIAEGTPLKLTFVDLTLGISDISYGETGNAAFNRINNSTGLDVGNEFIPIRDGYDFLGWYTALDGGEKYDFNAPITEDTTVYPHWMEIAFSFDTSDCTATYGDGALEARTATAEGTVSYSSSNESVAVVDGNGVVTVLNAGETTITASLAATEGHAGISASYTLTVKPKPLAVTTADKTVYVGSQKPDLSTAEFTVSGIVNGDEGNVNVTLSYATEPDMSRAGEYAITATTTNGNYTIASVTGKLTVTNRPSSGGSYSNITTKTEKNDDGSTTTTTTNKTTGTVTETTKNTDGSTNTVVTEKDGTVTETNKTADGITGTTVTDKDGYVTEISAKVPASAAEGAEQSGEAVTLPVEVEAVADSDDAVEISVDVPSGGTTVEIPVDDVTPGTMVVLVNKDGTEEVVRKSGVTETGVVVVLDEDATIKVIDNSKHFEDVHPVDHWAEEAVDFVTARGIYNGTSATTFSPDNPMTRGMLAVVLHNLEDNPDHDFDGTFHDVADGSWYEDGIHWAADEGIVSGYGNGLYGPNDHITREQLAVMLWRYAGSPESNHDVSHFTDEDKISGYALQAIRWANENGIINGKGGGILDPKGNATRAQVAQMLKNFISNAF